MKSRMKEFTEAGSMVIAGAGRGLGKTLALQASREGFSLALISRTERDLKEIQNILKAEDPQSERKVTSHVGDLSNEQSAKEIFAAIKKEHGSIGVLVNSMATWTGGRSVLELSKADIQRSLDLNFFTAFNTTKEVLMDRGTTKTPLSIINVGATASLRGSKNAAAFCIAKSALRILSQSLAKEWGPSGVHVAHFVIDGLIDNPRTRELNPNRPDNRYMKMESLVQEILHVAVQSPDCWTFEWDARTFNADW